MSNERRYDDHEVRQILNLAIGTEDGTAQSLPSSDGLTLLELQEVGREVGVPADRMAQAVAAFGSRGEFVPRSTTLGVPTSVGIVVPLPRSPSEREWELLVAELRTTFGGKGEMASPGGFREWSHGRLQVFIEPTQSGHRLRVTDSSAAVAGMIAGGLLLAWALVGVVITVFGQGNFDVSRLDEIGEIAVPALISLLGGGLLVRSATSLSRWIRQQEQRMEQIGKRAVALLSAPQSTED